MNARMKETLLWCGLLGLMAAVVAALGISPEAAVVLAPVLGVYVAGPKFSDYKGKHREVRMGKHRENKNVATPLGVTLGKSILSTVEKGEYNCTCQVGGVDAMSVDTDWLRCVGEQLTEDDVPQTLSGHDTVEKAVDMYIEFVASGGVDKEFPWTDSYRVQAEPLLRELTSAQFTDMYRLGLLKVPE